MWEEVQYCVSPCKVFVYKIYFHITCTINRINFKLEKFQVLEYIYDGYIYVKYALVDLRRIYSLKTGCSTLFPRGVV